MPKGPFRSYTSEQILASEAVTYVVVVGIEFYNVDGNYFFSKSVAVRHCNKIFRHLLGELHSGTRKEQKNARRVLNNLRVERLRIH